MVLEADRAIVSGWSAIRRLSCTLSPAKFLENEVPNNCGFPNFKLTHYRHIAFAPRAGRDLSPGALFLCQKKDPAEAGSYSVASRVSGRDGHPGARTHDLEVTVAGVGSTLCDLLAEDGVVGRSLGPESRSCLSCL